MRPVRTVLTACACLFSAALLAQQPSRSGALPLPALKTNASLPCGGTVLASEAFSGALPAGFVIWDLDDRTPDAGTALQKGWQLHQDYRDTTNQAMVSPSWYDPAGQSDDWLISPQISLGAAPCFSWMAYSQDRYYPETYEIRISTTTPDSAGFAAHAPLLTVTDENHDPAYRSLNLSAFAGQQVFLAMRHISTDRFVLVTDNWSVTNQNQSDAGITQVTSLTVPKGDTLRITGRYANYGTDTLREVQVAWQMDGGPIQTTTRAALLMAPNTDAAFGHDSLYIADSVDAWHTLCIWTTLPNTNTDQDMSNDTLCVQIRVGSPVSRPDPSLLHVVLYPNPAQSQAFLRCEGLPAAGMRAELLSLQGQRLQTLSPDAAGQYTFDLNGLPAGLYLVRLLQDGVPVWTGKLAH